MLAMGSPPYTVHEDERSNLFCCPRDFKMTRAEHYVVVESRSSRRFNMCTYQISM